MCCGLSGRAGASCTSGEHPCPADGCVGSARERGASVAIGSGRIQWLFGEGHAGLAESSALCAHTHPVPPAPGVYLRRGISFGGQGQCLRCLQRGVLPCLSTSLRKALMVPGPDMGSHPRAAQNGVELDVPI